VDAELAGGLPQPDLAGELVGLLGQLPPLPQDTGLGEGVATQAAALGRQGAADTPWSWSSPPAALTARSRQWSRTWQDAQMALAAAPPPTRTAARGATPSKGAGTGPSLLARLRRTLHLAPGAMPFRTGRMPREYKAPGVA
jgi:hypothetical protein